MNELTYIQILAGVIKEGEELPKDQWKKASGKLLEKYKQEILNLIKTAYSEIGGHPNYTSTSDTSTSDAQVWELIDLDDEPGPDAVGVAKQHGKKLVGIGHDGTKPAKSAAVKHEVSLLKKSGYYIEVSGRMYDILKSSGIKVVDDEETVRSILKGKNIKWQGDGWYTRDIGGDSHTKIMMGKPKA